MAEEKRIRLENRLLNGEGVQRESRVPIGELVEGYHTWSLANKRPGTVMNDQARIQRYLAFTKAATVQDVTTKSVMDYFAHRSLRDSVVPTTILREREILHAMMTYAVRVGYAVRNPVSDVPRPRIPQKDPRFLRSKEIDALLQTVAGDRIAPLIATAVYAGLRREELCWLTWDDLDEINGVRVLRVRAKRVGHLEHFER